MHIKLNKMDFLEGIALVVINLDFDVIRDSATNNKHSLGAVREPNRLC